MGWGGWEQTARGREEEEENVKNRLERGGGGGRRRAKGNFVKRIGLREADGPYFLLKNNDNNAGFFLLFPAYI